MVRSEHRPAAAASGERKSRSSTLRFWLGLALFAWAFRNFLVAPFNITSGSMLPAMLVGDYVMVAKWPYGYSRYSLLWSFPPFPGRIFSDLPERGDVVVFRPAGADTDFVKRVVGLPGDIIELRGGILVLNGKPLPRRFAGPVPIPVSANSPCRVVPPGRPIMARASNGTMMCLYPGYREAFPGGGSHLILDQVDKPRADDFPPLAVPDGHVFMLGDNRDDSLDSRFSIAEGGVDLVPVENLVGRAMFVFWSTDGSASYWKPWTWFTALRWDRLGSGFGGGK